jgi:hypothetical protein
LGEFDLGCAGALAQREAGHRLSVVVVGWFPAKGIGQAGRWTDLDVLPDQVEELAIGRLHRDPVSAAHSHVEGHLGTDESLGPPPLGDLIRVGHRLEPHNPTG